jgi:putative tricarboxylic transport membrane protein
MSERNVGHGAGTSPGDPAAGPPPGETAAGPPEGRSPAPTARRFGHQRQEVLVAVLVLGVFSYLRFDLQELIIGRRGIAALDPDFWPTVLLNAGIVLSLVYLFIAVQKLRKGGPAPVAEGDGRDVPGVDDDAAAAATPVAEEQERGDLLKLAIGAVVLFVYIYMITRAGFVPSTLVFSIVFLIFAGERRPLIIALFPVGVTAVIVYTFTRLLVVPLPRGSGIFLELSTYLY